MAMDDKDTQNCPMWGVYSHVHPGIPHLMETPAGVSPPPVFRTPRPPPDTQDGSATQGSSQCTTRQAGVAARRDRPVLAEESWWDEGQGPQVHPRTDPSTVTQEHRLLFPKENQTMDLMCSPHRAPAPLCQDLPLPHPASAHSPLTL